MKIVALIIILAIIIGLIGLLKINATDNKARKDAIKVMASIESVRCKQRLKSDKSLVTIAFRGQVYTVFFKDEVECKKYKINQPVSVYFSKKYNKLFLTL